MHPPRIPKAFLVQAHLPHSVHCSFAFLYHTKEVSVDHESRPPEIQTHTSKRSSRSSIRCSRVSPITNPFTFLARCRVFRSIYDHS